MNSLNPEDQREVDTERCRALCAAYLELADQSPEDDATLMKLIDLLEEVDELMWSGRAPRRADGGISRFNLPRLYSRTGSWERYLAWIRHEIEQEPSLRTKVGWLSTMATMAAQKLGDLPRAASFLEEAIELDPTAEGVRTRLESLAKEIAQRASAPDGVPNLASRGKAPRG